MKSYDFMGLFFVYNMLKFDGPKRKQTKKEIVMSKKLVAYFSASGTTAAVAKTLAEAADADLYEIKPQAPYTRADLDWTNKKSHSSVEMNNTSSRPALADKNAPVAGCDTVFLGSLYGGIPLPPLSRPSWRSTTSPARPSSSSPPPVAATWGGAPLI